jgi:hypothetical protein
MRRMFLFNMPSKMKEEETTINIDDEEQVRLSLEENILSSQISLGLWVVSTFFFSIYKVGKGWLFFNER